MTEEIENTKVKDASNNNDDPTKVYVSTSGIVIIALYLIVLGIFIMYGLFSFWPHSSSMDTNGVNLSNVIFLNSSFEITYELRLILLVAMAGALGSLVHAFRSFFWYVGNREFVRSWVLMYILLPLVGSFLSLIFYFVIRGGLFSTQTSIEATNPFGFVGLAGLIGMFSNQAALKLQEIAKSVFSTQETTEGKDTYSSKPSTSAEDSENSTPSPDS